jgi:plastocyanin
MGVRSNRTMGTTPTMEKLAEAASGRLTVAIVGLEGKRNGPALVTDSLESIPGVVRVYFDWDTEMAYVEYREAQVTPGRVLAAIEQAGLAVGDVTVRSAAPGEVFPPEAERPLDDLMPDDHSCCGPAVNESAQDESIRAEGAGTARSAGGRQGAWPFPVRMSLFLAAVVAVLGPALWLIRPMSSNAMGADYSVNMSMTGFTPATLSIPAGKPVSIQFNNVDSPFHGITNGALHQFAIDSLGVDVRIDGKQSTMINLPALEPGTYEYYCNVCCGGKVNPSMQGKITVRGPESAQTIERVSQR